MELLGPKETRLNLASGSSGSGGNRALWKRELFDWTTGGEQTPFPANKHHSYARVPFIIIFMTFCAFEGMDGVNTNEVCTDLLNVLQKKRLVTQAQHNCFQGVEISPRSSTCPVDATRC